MSIRPTTLLLMFAVTMPATSTVADDDPTRPPTPAEIQAWFGNEPVEVETARSWQLQSVLLAEGRRVAVINDQRVTIGDRINNAAVIAIEPGHVLLRHNDDLITLTIQSLLVWSDDNEPL